MAGTRQPRTAPKPPKPPPKNHSAEAVRRKTHRQTRLWTHHNNKKTGVTYVYSVYSAKYSRMTSGIPKTSTQWSMIKA
jgi:hypothetical protein